MPVVYLHDSSPMSSHLRRRSSTSHSNLASLVTSPAPSYNEATGVIQLPPSPPLLAWDDDRARKSEKSGLGLLDLGGGKGAPLAWRAAPKGRAYSLPRPWYTAMALTSVTVAFVFLLSYLVPPECVALSPPCAFLEVEAKLTNYSFVCRSSYQPASLMSRVRSTKPACDPYSSFGTLQINDDDADRSSWAPFDASCQPPNFLAKLRDFTLHHHHASEAYAHASDFTWMQNKTALLIGDSVSRELVENFCILVGEESEVLRPGHHWSPPAPLREPVKAKHAPGRPSRLHSRGFRVVRDASRPRICYVPKLDFLVRPCSSQPTDLPRSSLEVRAPG